jgi:hypothetical protein
MYIGYKENRRVISSVFYFCGEGFAEDVTYVDKGIRQQYCHFLRY